MTDPGPQADTFERCMSVGGVAVFPADTVYGLACDAANRLAVERLYRFKRRPLSKPSAVMFFDLELALSTLAELGPATRDALARLLPGPVSLLVPNPGERFPLACGDDPTTLGLRVPVVPALAGVRWPVMQSSANLAGEPEARRLQDVPEAMRRRADLVIDGGELPGTASTVIDLRRYEDEDRWSIVRAGAVSDWDVAAVLDFEPGGYLEMIRGEIPAYDMFQAELTAATGSDADRVLELGTGTGETAQRLLARHPAAHLVGLDGSERMLTAARERLPAARVDLRVGRLQDALPRGPFDLVASALCVHHLDATEKRDLFARVRETLAPRGRFVLADVVVPEDPADAIVPLSLDFDRPDSLGDQVAWLQRAGFDVRVAWEHRDLAVVVADRP